MAELKYQKYILDRLRTPKGFERRDSGEEREDFSEWMKNILQLDDSMIEGAFYTGFVWYLKPPKAERSTDSHSHDFDEVLGFLGSDWENPQDMGGEIEFWLEDEKYILNRSTIIFIPKGMMHCPLRILKVDRPILHFGIGTQGRYSR
jgi:hypothetical protein